MIHFVAFIKEEAFRLSGMLASTALERDTSLGFNSSSLKLSLRFNFG